MMGTCEKVRNCSEGQSSYINTSFIALIFTQKVLIFQLTMNLLSCANECHSIHTCHDCLFDGFTLYVIFQFSCQLSFWIIWVCYGLFKHFNDHLCDMCVNVTRSLCDTKIYLIGTLHISTKSCIMLKTITGSVLMDV